MRKLPTINGRKIRVGLVGCGRISVKHFQAIEQFKSELRLISICDVDPVASEPFSKKYGVPAYIDFEEMLKNESLDIVVLCTPSGLHASQAIIASGYKVHIITEKPMATKFDDALQMVQACDEANVRLFVVKQNRLNPTLQLLRRAIDEKRFGKIFMVQVNVFWNRGQEYYDQGGGWRGTWEFDGGAFMNQASHYVDLLTWLIGSVETVQVIKSTTREIEAEDSGVVNLRWRHGAIGSMAVTMLTFPKNYEGSITIIGEKGTARIGGVAVNEILKWEFDEPRDYDEEIYDASYETSNVYGFGHPLYYRNCIAVLRGEEEAETDGRAGLKSMELLVAFNIAGRDGRTVNLPLNL